MFTNFEQLDASTPHQDQLNDHNYLLFSKFIVPQMLCRHPTPAEGRDDDINLLSEVLQDILTKLGRYPDIINKERILFAPDHKIAKNLIRLMKTNRKCKQFLPEFPLLHLKKSKINNLFTAYNDAGIIHLLKYMKDSEQEQDWMELVSLRNIETAAKNIKRLALALHLAFLVQFITTLPDEDVEQILSDLDINNLAIMNQRGLPKINKYLHDGVKSNATFAIHFDMLTHCDEILGISIAERIGGPEGYALLLACVKSSLPFSFLNGATSYASFCVELLHVHYTAGPFHQSMKLSLFTTPHKDSNVNCALDTQREMDHQEALKGFRPRATLQTVIPRMAVVDHFTEVQKTRTRLNQTDYNSTQSIAADNTTNKSQAADVSETLKLLNFEISPKDIQFILPLSRLIIRSGGLKVKKDPTPRNIYDPSKPALASAILDRESYAARKYLIKKYACMQGLFQLTHEDIPNMESVEGSSDILKRIKTMKGVTLRRSTIKTKELTDEEKKEIKRQAEVKRQTKVINCFSSDMNTCQALVKPDCTKASLQKSPGIKKGLYKILSLCFPDLQASKISEKLAKEMVVLSDARHIPTQIQSTIRYATVEFAGVKFKTQASTWDDYIVNVEKDVIGQILREFSGLKRIIICEEKYSFTPDQFKAATRQKRQKAQSLSISHLKAENEIAGQDKLKKSTIIHTDIGKRLISNYLAENISKLDIRHALLLDVDSEYVTQRIECSNECEEACIRDHGQYTTPVRAVFNSEKGFVQQVSLEHVKQTKGEAEMAQVDWLFDILGDLKDNDSVLSIVTSADIDSLIIHLFCLALHWPRNETGGFKHKVYVLLQKQKRELYDITRIIEILESRFGRTAASNIPIVLCLGGNDFLPKFHGLSHEKWVTETTQIPDGLENIVQYTIDKKTVKPVIGTVNEEIYFEIVKRLYCPSSIDADAVSLDAVRQMSIKLPSKQVRHPTSWMPPRSALLKVIQLVNWQLAYLLSVSKANANLPDFSTYQCF